uniref:Uncharacterized protein n=1 Tax=viral metagenome TaxID=1070528 RepID=A0A6C0AFE0_9ZZZZ
MFFFIWDGEVLKILYDIKSEEKHMTELLRRFELEKLKENP